MKPDGNFLSFICPNGLDILKPGCSCNFHLFCNIKFGNLQSDTDPSVCKHISDLLSGDIRILNIIDSTRKYKVGIIFHRENLDLVSVFSLKVNNS